MKFIKLKPIVIILFTILFCSFISYLAFSSFGESWKLKTEQFNSHASPYSSMVFFDTKSGLVLTSNEIKRTNNGGVSWDEVTFQSDQTGLFSLTVMDDKTVWSVGSELKRPVVLKSMNQGVIWEKLTFGNNDSTNINARFTRFFDICFSNSGDIWIVGDGGVIKAIINEQTLKLSNVFNTEETLFSVSCSDSGEIWAVGEKGAVYNYYNGWTKKAFEKNYLFGKVISNEQGIWILGSEFSLDEQNTSKGVLFRSLDNGRSWENKTPELAMSLYDLHIENKQGWLVGAKGNIYYTNDNGNSWRKEKSPTENDLLKIFFLDSNHIWISGDKGTILFR